MTTRRCDHCKSGVLYLHQGDRWGLVGVTVRMIEFGLVPPPGRPQGSHPHFILRSRPYNDYAYMWTLYELCLVPPPVRPQVSLSFHGKVGRLGPLLSSCATERI